MKPAVTLCTSSCWVESQEQGWVATVQFLFRFDLTENKIMITYPLGVKFGDSG